LIASRDVDFIVSATAITPIISFSVARSITVFPSDSKDSISSFFIKGILCSANNALVQRKYFLPSISPTIHFHGTAEKCVTANFFIFFSFQYFTIASAKGCSELASNATAICKKNFSSYQLVKITSVTFGFHSVIVPVLSKTIAFTLHKFSKGSHHFIKTHFSAHFPVPTINAVGVARPSAHGQAITITAEKYINAD
jgi:hypothetical protein